MSNKKRRSQMPFCVSLPVLLLIPAGLAIAQLDLGPEELVRADLGDIVVGGYSVPSYAYWDGDDRMDLIIGEGGGSGDAKVRVYLNVGTACAPRFSGFFYAQSEGNDLACPASGCLGLFPRIVYWDADARKDLLIGQAGGKVMIFLNVGTEEDATFDGGTYLQVGSPGFETDIHVGARATATVADWNNDGKKDLVVGGLDGRIHLFLNEGSDVAPVFRSETLAQADGADLFVPSARSSPVILDLDGDNKKDLLAGNTSGQLLFYRNVGTDDAPSFSTYVPVESDGVAIDLSGSARSRPFVCDWTGDGRFDVLIGAGDGKVHLYQGASGIADKASDFDCDHDVDLEDYLIFQQCLSGPGNPVESGCEMVDFDQDGDADISDFHAFGLDFTG